MTSSPDVTCYGIIVTNLKYPVKGTVGTVIGHTKFDLCSFRPLDATTPVWLRNEDVERQAPLWEPPAGAIAATRIEYRTLMQFGLDAAIGTDHQDTELNKFIAEGWELVQIGNPVVIIDDNIPAMYRQIILRKQG